MIRHFYIPSLYLLMVSNHLVYQQTMSSNDKNNYTSIINTFKWVYLLCNIFNSLFDVAIFHGID
jgi:hypothetical protein